VTNDKRLDKHRTAIAAAACKWPWRCARTVARCHACFPNRSVLWHGAKTARRNQQNDRPRADQTRQLARHERDRIRSLAVLLASGQSPSRVCVCRLPTHVGVDLLAATKGCKTTVLRCYEQLLAFKGGSGPGPAVVFHCPFTSGWAHKIRTKSNVRFLEGERQRARVPQNQKEWQRRGYGSESCW
jgi:hypothetical protein